MTERSILLVGEAPNARGQYRNLDVVLVCRAAGVRPVAGTMARLDEDFPLLCEFTLSTRHVNLLHVYSGRKQRGSDFPEATAETAAIDFVARLRRGYVAERQNWKWPIRPRFVLFAGHRVGKAFGYRQKSYFEPRDRLDGVDAQVFVVPHPSRLNRYWNEPRHCARARAFLEGLVREVEAVELAL